MSEIELSVGGVKYSGWLGMDLTISMETLTGVFAVSVTDNIDYSSNKPIQALPTIVPGSTCKVYIDGQIVITGYIDKVTPIIEAKTHTIVIQGRDKTADLVDCSMVESTNQWKGLTADKIISRIAAPFGIPVIANVNVGSAFDNFLIEQGSTCFETIQKICYMRQLLAISDGQGGLLLTRAGTDTASSSLLEGENILRGEANYDFSERFSRYICKGQKQGDDNSTPETVTNNVGECSDTFITRYRPLLVIAEGQANIDNCTQRAKWEAAIRRGKSRKLNITVNGWTQSDGQLWGINKLVTVKSQLLGVGGTLLISQVNFKLDENGEITILTVTSPDSYSVDASGTQKTGAEKSNPYISG